MRRILAPVFLLLLLTLTACGDSGSGDDRDDGGDVAGTEVAAGPDAQRLAEARERWADAAISDYDWSYERVCFCPGLGFELEVRDGEPGSFTAVEGTRSGLPAGDVTDAEPAYRTVEDLFEMVESAIADEPASLDVEYDEQTGHPVRISIDPDAGTSDDEIGISVTALTAVAG